MLTQWQHKAGFAHEKARHAAGSAHRQTDTHTPKQEEERAAATEGASTCHAAAKDRLAHCAAVKGPLDGAKKKKINLSDGARCRTNHEPLLSTADETKIVSEK